MVDLLCFFFVICVIQIFGGGGNVGLRNFFFTRCLLLSMEQTNKSLIDRHKRELEEKRKDYVPSEWYLNMCSNSRN